MKERERALFEGTTNKIKTLLESYKSGEWCKTHERGRKEKSVDPVVQLLPVSSLRGFVWASEQDGLTRETVKVKSVH